MLLLLPLSLATAGASPAIAPVDRSTDGVESSLFPSRERRPASARLVELGACNPRIEVCERDEEDEAVGDERDERAPRPRTRGWLSVVGCNPRIKVCES